MLSRSSLTFHPYFSLFVSLQQTSCVPNQFVSLVSVTRVAPWVLSLGLSREPALSDVTGTP